VSLNVQELQSRGSPSRLLRSDELSGRTRDLPSLGSTATAYRSGDKKGGEN